MTKKKHSHYLSLLLLIGILIAPTAVNLALTIRIACWNLSRRLVKGDSPIFMEVGEIQFFNFHLLTITVSRF